MTGIAFSEVSRSRTVRECELLTERRYQDKKFRYVQLADDISASSAIGTVLYQKTGAADGIVTDDISDANRNQYIGVAVCVAAASSYIWIQYDGPFEAGKVQVALVSNTAVGDLLVGHATSDGVAARLTAGVAPLFAVIGRIEEIVGPTSTSVAAWLTGKGI